MLYHVASPYFKAYLASTRMGKAKAQMEENQDAEKN